MVVIARFRIRPDEFDLGRILRVPEGMTVDLETYVPSGGFSGLFFSIASESETDRTAFIDRVEEHPSVNELQPIEIFESRVLLAMDWDVRSDYLFQSVQASDGQILSVTGTVDEWEFVIRFRVHDGIKTFREHCEAHAIDFTLLRIYQLDESHMANHRTFGLTDAQREALILAVERGYFDLPRQCSTEDLAAELGISAQAVSERLRRGVANFVRHTLAENKDTSRENNNA